MKLALKALQRLAIRVLRALPKPAVLWLMNAASHEVIRRLVSLRPSTPSVEVPLPTTEPEAPPKPGTLAPPSPRLPMYRSSRFKH